MIPQQGQSRRKRCIDHDDRDIHEIKKRICSLQMDDKSVAVDSTPSYSGTNTQPSSSAVVVDEMDSDDSNTDEEEAVDDEGRIEVDEGLDHELAGRSAMLRKWLLKKDKPKDVVEAKIEDLIRSSLLREMYGQNGAAVPPKALFLCDAPWQDIQNSKQSETMLEDAMGDNVKGAEESTMDI